MTGTSRKGTAAKKSVAKSPIKKVAAKPVAKTGAKGAIAKSHTSVDESKRSDRSKRLLDLVMLLLGSRLPVPYRDIRDLFPAYKTANSEAGLRAFERDKAELLELGLPIRYITPEEDDSLEDGGYVIDVKRLRLPEVRLTPEEISALVLAANVARTMPGGAYPRVVDLALKKLAFDVPEAPDTPTDLLGPPQVLMHVPSAEANNAEAIGETFALIEQATRFRKKLLYTYIAAANGMTTRRELFPYALVHREGAWLVIGYCLLRKEVRSFRVDRMRDVVMGAKPRSPDFERPESFDARAYANRSPWTFSLQPNERVTLLFAAAARDAAVEDFGANAIRTEDEKGLHVEFDCGNPDFTVSRILTAKGAIMIEQGERLQQRLQAELTALRSMYADMALAEHTRVGEGVS